MSNGRRVIPSIASEGIHEIDVTDERIRMSTPPATTVVPPCRGVEGAPGSARRGASPPPVAGGRPIAETPGAPQSCRMPTGGAIRVVLADDNLIVREGVRALLMTSDDIEVAGVAGDYDELVAV